MTSERVAWPDEVLAAINALEEKYDIELVSGPHHDGWVERSEKQAKEIERLRTTLQQCLRQWKMYSEMAENNEGFDLAKEKSPEADIYRAAYALAHAPA